MKKGNINSIMCENPLVKEEYSVNAEPVWYADEPFFFRSRTTGSFDEIAVKDPSIVFAEGKYHLFYTGVTNKGLWQTGYSSAPTIAGLSSAPRVFMTTISEPYFCAPQVFYFEPQGKWYIIYNSGKFGAGYSTTKTISDPGSWSAPCSLEVPNSPPGYDFWIICDDKYAYIFYTTDGSLRTISWRRTALSDFPVKWSEPVTAITDSFEGVCVYKNLADNKYYLLSEDDYDNRYYELWSADHLAGPWTKLAEKWASFHSLVHHVSHWTDNISHGEIIRAGINQEMAIHDINRVDFLIQGVVNGDYRDYVAIPWDIGVIRNYK